MSGAVGADAPLPVAVVILADGAADDARPLVDTMLATARVLGAAPLVVAGPRGWAAHAGARVVHLATGASRTSALRAGMAQLGNSPARYALVWPVGAITDAARLEALLRDAARTRPAFALLEGDDPDRAPVLVGRDAWLDLMTLGEQGMAAVGARCGVHRVASRAREGAGGERADVSPAT